ncbi:Xaa-Pro peptidase family protein [Polymorphobacter sp. PAMC 29334]|uniref:M24 family metallopeptidase n=1 Tax=Polymorphobacter sp. PAMC 29334 TaxID=2862331 RepID=UPI001C67387B|nr:Xaa-Pro peptidase family protein [Polymorphobacter sp. PAMC 29334]QYE35922.1 Xaa-Pro peptidase family protein [Polymorphobacter sp. PAMC 29334]
MIQAGLDRRSLLVSGAVLGALAILPSGTAAAEIDTAGLTSMTGDVRPIGPAERAARLDAARALMAAHGIGAVVIEPGASMVYFTGVKWRRSERLTLALLFATGDPVIVTPFFEEPSVRQSLGIPADVRVWQEDESPVALAAKIIGERGAARGDIGIEETVRFFASDGLAKALPEARIVSANPVVRGCRMLKTPAELALMQKASDITIAAYRWTWPRVREGMTPGDIGALMDAATVKLGGVPEFALVLLGEAAAYPHGSSKPQRVREGEVVLMDCGCTVDGYQSDISRTFVPGRAPDAVRRVWDTVARGQQVAFGAAKVGAPAGSVDDAVRAFYTAQGFGPGYRLPGLSHRTGHGIGLDGHEPVNLVHGETTPLIPGMCFSDEPGLYLPGQFGVRLEDCFHITADGPRWFSTPPPSLDRPFD